MARMGLSRKQGAIFADRHGQFMAMAQEVTVFREPDLALPGSSASC
jgi:hypothetical protein